MSAPDRQPEKLQPSDDAGRAGERDSPPIGDASAGTSWNPEELASRRAALQSMATRHFGSTSADAPDVTAQERAPGAAASEAASLSDNGGDTRPDGGHRTSEGRSGLGSHRNTARMRDPSRLAPIGPGSGAERPVKLANPRRQQEEFDRRSRPAGDSNELAQDDPYGGLRVDMPARSSSGGPRLLQHGRTTGEPIYDVDPAMVGGIPDEHRQSDREPQRARPGPAIQQRPSTRERLGAGTRRVATGVLAAHLLLAPYFGGDVSSDPTAARPPPGVQIAASRSGGPQEGDDWSTEVVEAMMSAEVERQAKQYPRPSLEDNE